MAARNVYAGWWLWLSMCVMYCQYVMLILYVWRCGELVKVAGWRDTEVEDQGKEGAAVA